MVEAGVRSTTDGFVWMQDDVTTSPFSTRTLAGEPAPPHTAAPYRMRIGLLHPFRSQFGITWQFGASLDVENLVKKPLTVFWIFFLKNLKAAALIIRLLGEHPANTNQVFGSAPI
jgi:hypothetical protein